MLPMLLKDLDMIDRFFSPQFTDIKTKFPKSNIYIDNDDNLQFEFALAGFPKENISVSYDSNKLTITGAKKNENPMADVKKIFAANIAYRDFEVSYMVPAYYNNAIPEAIYKDGLLYITLPKTIESNKKTIEIQ